MEDPDSGSSEPVDAAVTVGASEAVVDLAGTESVTVIEDAFFSAWAAWWRAAWTRFRSLSDGPRWRGRWGAGGGAEAGTEGGSVWGAPGWPRVHLNSMLAWPPLVDRYDTV